MLICSCAVVSDHDIELALLEIMIEEDAQLPTPGVVWRHLQKKLNCCGCAPLAVDVIYQKLEELEAKGLICPCACANAWDRKRTVAAREAKSAPSPASAIRKLAVVPDVS